MTPVPELETAEQLLRADSQTLAGALNISAADARREVQLLLSRALGGDFATLLGHPERIPQARASQWYVEKFARRLGGEPIAYILRERRFYGLHFEITADVLIPRPETEALIDVMLEQLPEDAEGRVIDLGTGSGCIAITLAKLRPHVRVIATDVSKAALAVAARNAERHGVFNLELRAGEWYDPVAGLRFDVIVSNPPYIAQGDAHLSEGDLRFEPRAALCGGTDGLDALRAIVAHAPAHLKPGGQLVVEHGYDQAAPVAELMRQAGFAEVLTRTDLAGIARVVAGRLA